MNQPLTHIKTVEGLLMAAMTQLDTIKPEDDEQTQAKYEAIEYLTMFQESQLKDLRDAFE